MRGWQSVAVPGRSGAALLRLGTVGFTAALAGMIWGAAAVRRSEYRTDSASRSTSELVSPARERKIGSTSQLERSSADGAWEARITAMLASAPWFESPRRSGTLSELVRSLGADEVTRLLAEFDGVGRYEWREELRRALLARLAETHPTEALRLAVEIGEEPIRRMALQVVAERWAQIDAEAAAKWTLGLADTAMLEIIGPALAGVLEARSSRMAAEFVAALPADPVRNELLGGLVARWSQTDFSQALDWIDGVPAGPVKEEALIHLSYRFQQIDPADAVAYALTLASSNQQFLGIVTSQWAARDPRAVAAWVIQLPEGPSRSAAIASLTTTWAGYNGREATEFAGGLPPGPAQNAAMLTATAAWARQDPYSALEWVARYSQAGIQAESYNNILTAWAQRDTATAAEWLVALPEGTARDQAFSVFSGALFEKHPAIAITFAEAIVDTPLRVHRMEDIARRWLAADPEAATAAITRSSIPPEMLNRLLGRLSATPGRDVLLHAR